MLAHPSLNEAEVAMGGFDSEITVLHVDDEPNFTEVCAELLEREGELLTVETAASALEGLEYLAEETPDCIVSDYDMPKMNGLEFLEEVRETHPRLPFILFTGKGSEEIASEAISKGVTDYLQKSSGQEQYGILRNRIRNGVANYRSQRSLQIFRSAVEHSGHSIYITDRKGTIEYVNPSFTEITGYTPKEAVGRTPKILKSGHHGDEYYQNLWKTILEGDVWKSEIVNQRKDGELYVAKQTIAPIFINDDDPAKFVAVNQEITEQKQREIVLEKQFDNLGALNRMLRYRIRDDLQAVTGYAELLEDHVNGGGGEYLEILQDRSWSVFDRLKAAQNFAALLDQTKPEGPVELREILERAARCVGSIDKDVTVTIDEAVSATQIAANVLLESVVRILVETLFRQEEHCPAEVHVRASERNGSLHITVTEDSKEGDTGEIETLEPTDVADLETMGMGTSELYIVQGLVDGHGGQIQIAKEDSGGLAFGVDVPKRRFVAEPLGRP